MVSELTQYYAQALMVQLDKQIIQSSKFFSFDEFREQIKHATKPPIPDSMTSDVLLLLAKDGSVTVLHDDVAGDFVKLEYARLHKFVSQAYSSQSSFIYRYSQVGEILLQKIVESLGDSVAAEETGLPTTVNPLEDVPASDRVVSRADNEEAVATIQADIKDLRRIVQEDNEVGAEIGDAREILDMELEIGDVLLDRPHFRLKSLLGWLLPALSFLADRFAGGAVGELAKRLVMLLLGLHS